MAVLTLIFIVLWLAVVVGLRYAIHLRQKTGPVAVLRPARPGTTEWWASLISTLGLLLLIAAPIAELLGLQPIPLLDRLPIRLTGAVLAVLGVAITFPSQLAMGASWRGSVNPDERTDLVTTGPFRWVRNPVLTGVLITFAGLALMTPNLLAAAALALAALSLELQVRYVEEPYLRQVHDTAYVTYAARTGRFLPLLGRLR